MRFVNYRPGATAVAVATLLALSTTTANADPAADPIGPACASYTPGGRAGASSVAGTAQQPLTVAVSRIPTLSALSAALSGQLNPAVNLVDTFNGGQVTVFAPVDNAFSRLPPEATASPQIDAARLTHLLTYHVIPGRFSPGLAPPPSTAPTGPCRTATYPSRVHLITSGSTTHWCSAAASPPPTPRSTSSTPY